MAAEVDFSGPLCRKGSLVPCSLFSILYWLALDYCWNTAASHAFVSFYKIPTLLGILHLALKRAKLMKLKLYSICVFELTTPQCVINVYACMRIQ